MSSRSEPRTLLATADLLTSARSLLNALFMAAGSLGDREEADAFQQVIDVASNRLSDALTIVEDLRNGGAE